MSVADCSGELDSILENFPLSNPRGFVTGQLQREVRLLEKKFSQFYLVAQINLISIGQLQREVRLLENRASYSLIYPVAKNGNISSCNASALCDLIIVILSYLISYYQDKLDYQRKVHNLIITPL